MFAGAALLQAALAAYLLAHMAPFNEHEISYVYLRMLAGNYFLDTVLNGIPLALVAFGAGVVVNRLAGPTVVPRREYGIWMFYAIAVVVGGAQFKWPLSFFFGARSLLGLLPVLASLALWRLWRSRGVPQGVHGCALWMACWGPVLAAWSLDIWWLSMHHLND